MTFLMTLPLFYGSAFADDFICTALKKCPSGVMCTDMILKLNITDQTLLSVIDISNFDRLEIDQYTVTENVLSISGKQDDGLFYAQISLKKLPSTTRRSNFLITPYGHRYKLRCEKLIFQTNGARLNEEIESKAAVHRSCS